MHRSRGFSLLEVMIAVLVLAVGLMAIALMLSVSMRQSHVSATHNQVNLLAQSMIDRMSANVQGVWLDSYDGTHTAAVSGISDCGTGGCTPATLAARDITQWRAELAQMLPAGASGTIACTPASAVPDAETLRKTPVYDGVCDLILRWQEQDVDDGVVDTEVAWRFTP